jgi:hypothetical protein
MRVGIKPKIHKPLFYSRIAAPTVRFGQQPNGINRFLLRDKLLSRCKREPRVTQRIDTTGPLQTSPRSESKHAMPSTRGQPRVILGTRAVGRRGRDAVAKSGLPELRCIA